ncbi:MAG: dTDP-4-dehydrorhamnose 3,5-epimerase family protein [Candidatus Odinarchaeia archaeon]
MIEGIKVKDLVKNIDERGFFSELLREDWKELLEEDDILQFNLSYSYQGIIRAWHRHLRGQVDYFICAKGAIKVCAFDDRKESETYGELDEYILSGDQPSVLKVPGYLWHGYKAISPEPTILLYGVNRLYDYKNPDEERRPWNDPTIIPRTINGKPDDPRVGKPWDWNYPPHK